LLETSVDETERQTIQKLLIKELAKAKATADVAQVRRST
jgi:hypothetical protein